LKKTKLKTVLTNADFQAMSDIMGGLLDKQSAVLASKEDLRALETRIESKMATKQDLADLKDYMHEGFEAVMEGIDAVAEKLAEKEKVACTS
jgi:uncharacterized protein YydD (DUF2326 family)